MSKRMLTVCAVLACCWSGLVGATDVREVLKRADEYRLYEKAAKVVTRIEVYKDKVLDRDRLYHVYIKPGRRSIVVFRHPAEFGQKMLMLDDNFWLLLPNSKRPVRITATQKLLGEAAAGDVATMTWSEDYAGKLAGDDLVGNVAALKVELYSAREGTTYDRILLWVRADNFAPIKAELYLASGKLAKVARYEMGQMNGRAAVVRTFLEDRIQTNRTTVMRYESIEATEIPDKVYNPAYLVRENLGTW